MTNPLFKPPHEHEWEESEVNCEDCGSHNAVCCVGCGEVLDLVYDDDPR
jgi:hypothetical protein